MSLTELSAAEISLIAHGVAATATALHALLHSTDPRAAWGWIAICALAPLVGPVLYLLFGTHRVARPPQSHGNRVAMRDQSTPPKLAQVIEEEVAELVRIGDATTGRTLLSGNHLDILRNGDDAYPEMLRAIDGACTSVWMSTYIFRSDHTGKAFAEILARAHARGVEVRVLIDAVGDLYSWPRGSRMLQKRGIDARCFQISHARLPIPHLNLRNHRKLLVIDGRVAFTGGLNIGDHHWLSSSNRSAEDYHFRIEGPIVEQLRDVFQEDWSSVGGDLSRKAVPEILRAPNAATSHCRVITDGPHEQPDRLELILLGALSNAHRRVSIVTPYLVPMPVLSRALEAAAYRGVEVVIILPEHSNLPWVDWASRHWLRTLLARGVRVFLLPRFVHAKLFVVDEYYSLIGSANLDARSLSINCELNVEIYDNAFGHLIQAHAAELKLGARELLIAEIERDGIFKRFRNAASWLMSAYL